MADATSTFERSCAHWSEAKRLEMEAFYSLAGRDYVELARAADWRAWLAERQDEAGGRPLRLLDVACGSGKFPEALAVHANIDEASLRPVSYDLLDPSAFSLKEAASVLRPPFEPAARFECTLQDLPGVEPYDVVWATHALYALPEAELTDGLAAFARAMGRDGRGVIAHATSKSHYLRFDAAFREAFGTGRQPYASAEAVEAAAEAAGLAVERQTLRYVAASGDETAVEGYLQRCAFDDTETLASMKAHPVTGAYLAGCRVEDGWRFAQEVRLLWLAPGCT